MNLFTVPSPSNRENGKANEVNENLMEYRIHGQSGLYITNVCRLRHRHRHRHRQIQCTCVCVCMCVYTWLNVIIYIRPYECQVRFYIIHTLSVFPPIPLSSFLKPTATFTASVIRNLEYPNMFMYIHKPANLTTKFHAFSVICSHLWTYYNTSKLHQMCIDVWLWSTGKYHERQSSVTLFLYVVFHSISNSIHVYIIPALVSIESVNWYGDRLRL